MATILVLGNINIETTVAVDHFPIDYSPVRYLRGGIQQSVSAVGYNVARALSTLGNDVRLLSIVGRDVAAQQIRLSLRAEGISDEHVLGLVEETAQSVVFYDAQGNRQIHTDLKDVLEQSYPADVFTAAARGCDLLVLTNISYSKSLLPIAKASGKPIVTDVQSITHLDDTYNQPFMESADILFLSGERLSESPEACIRSLQAKFKLYIVVVGLGAKGAVLGVRADDKMRRFAAVPNKNVISTGGAGDALCAAFVHSYLQSGDPYTSVEKAMIFASHKIGFASSSEGFLNDETLQKRYGVST